MERVERKRQNGLKVTSSVLTRLVFISALLGFIVGFGALVLLMPPAVQSSEIKQLPSDAERGAKVFYASGCGSCHSTPTAAGGASLQLGGGQSFFTPYGVFRAPNISMSQFSGSAVGTLRISKLQCAAEYPLWGSIISRLFLIPPTSI